MKDVLQCVPTRYSAPRLFVISQRSEWTHYKCALSERMCPNRTCHSEGNLSGLAKEVWTKAMSFNVSMKILQVYLFYNNKGSF